MRECLFTFGILAHCVGNVGAYSKVVGGGVHFKVGAGGCILMLVMMGYILMFC